MAQITKTPAQDLVEFGGWAGVPELAQITTESTEVLQAWKKSMPHLYADRRKEAEETQKVLHMEMLKGLLKVGRERGGDQWVASWDNVESASMKSADGDDPVTITQMVRAESLARVAELHQDAQQEPVYGARQSLRTQYTVKRISCLGPPAGEAPKKRKTSRTSATAAQAGGGLALGGLAEPVAEAAPSLPREGTWYFTRRMTLIHKKAHGEQWLPACSQRQAGSRQRPAAPGEVIWSGTSEEARAMGRRCCDSAECNWEL